MKNILITFVDDGQDFLTFQVEEESGQIVDVQPFQQSIWGSHKVLNLKQLLEAGETVIGMAVELDDPEGLLGTKKFFLKHGIEKIQRI